MNIQLKRQDGSAAESMDDLKEIFQEQFMPANQRVVDVHILNEYPQKEELSFPLIGEAEIMDNLRDTSNTSSPGPDHLNWLWLKWTAERKIPQQEGPPLDLGP